MEPLRRSRTRSPRATPRRSRTPARPTAESGAPGGAPLSCPEARLFFVKLSRVPRSRLPVFPMAALAALAVVLGHQLVYRLAVPSGAERAALLARTGHAYLPTTAHLVLLAALA